MKRLARRIATDLKTSKACAVYNSELARVFPKSMPAAKRQRSIEQFADEHGLSVDIFEVGLCAVFERRPTKRSTKSRVKKLK
jgi:hypothetical protein